MYRLFLLIPLFFLCSWVNPFSKYEWQSTDNGLKIWTDKGAGVKYHWNGGNRGGVIHGTGTLTISGSQKSSEKINAYYGTINEKGLFNNEAYSQKYIGRFKNWSPKSEKEYDGFGVLVLNNGYVYISVFEHNMPKKNAKTYIYRNDAIYYEGTCENYCEDEITGHGKLYNLRNKDLYAEGYFENGKLIKGKEHGETYTAVVKNEGKSVSGKVYLSKNKNIFYEGNFENDTFNGYGVMTILKVSGLNNAKFSGNWKNGMLNGYATYTSGKTYYKGGWLDNNKSGQGTMHYSDGSLYVGEWKYNKKTKGRIEFPNGDAYTGNWSNNARNGEGIYEYHDGSVYTGDWRDDLQYGQGELKTSSFTYSGSWEGGFFHGKGEISFQNGDFYSGDFNQGSMEGYGAYQFKNGNIYEGYFKNDTFSGEGEYQFNANKQGYDGIITYKGNFENGKPNGHGYFAMQAFGSEKPEFIIESEKWEGMKLPNYGKFIIPAENVMYEGPLVNGRPVQNTGKWSEYKDEDENTNQVKREAPEWLRDTSSFIKKHKAKWDKFYQISSRVLLGAPVVAGLVCGGVAAAGSGGIAALPAGFECAAIASEYSELALNSLAVADAGLNSLSYGVDCYEGYEGTCKDFTTGLLIDGAIVAAPKVLAPAAKKIAKTKVGRQAINIAKATKKSISTAVKGGIKKIKLPLKEISNNISNKSTRIKNDLKKYQNIVNDKLRPSKKILTPEGMFAKANRIETKKGKLFGYQYKGTLLSESKEIIGTIRSGVVRDNSGKVIGYFSRDKGLLTSGRAIKKAIKKEWKPVINSYCHSKKIKGKNIKLGEKGSGPILGENIESCYNIELPKYSQAHHIFPKAIEGEYGEKIRAILEKHNIDINDCANGIPLPGDEYIGRILGLPVHSGPVDALHGPKYLEYIYKELSKKDTKENVLNVMNGIKKSFCHNKTPWLK